MALPVHVTGVQCSGMLLVEVTLYEQVCVHLCATVAVMPAKHFNILVCVMCVCVCVCVCVQCCTIIGKGVVKRIAWVRHALSSVSF